MLRLLYLLPLISTFSFSQELAHNVYFETDEYVVKPAEEKKFQVFLERLDTLDVHKITIYGFCDDRGTDDYNLWLSKKRANAVKWYFKDNEFSDDLITILDGKGEIALDPLRVGNLNNIRQSNRRVEVLLEAGKQSKLDDSLEIPTAQEILKGELKVGDKVRLKNIYFKTGYSTVVPESIPTLKEVAEILLDRKDIYFTIQGHVCCTHDTYDAVDRKTNKRNLSISRAKFIYTYLLNRGIDKKRMKYMGLRRKFPLGGKAKFDRRVEIEITYVANDH
ncbi:MAG: OmpA family protein [Flavobacteriaceae bacterium]|nr:OmpA family protein [Bacteroidia bacterium]MBT8286611.1 OmpA family protein [Bacteroidia bacterium]NNF75136.1 OmpA family protein [Flavobacteriaceae bacterium]NNK72152.1 OmpA family protein [Flavobacteriaceae bacterium]